MYLSQEKKAEIFNKFGGSETNTGSTEGQIALFTYRINHLTEHLKKNHKDFNTERSLIRLVGKRRSLLDYLKAYDIEKYLSLIKELGFRKYYIKCISTNALFFFKRSFFLSFSLVYHTSQQHNF
jgi:small subunit ribosomal protein S15